MHNKIPLLSSEHKQIIIEEVTMQYASHFGGEITDGKDTCYNRDIQRNGVDGKMP